MRGEGRGGVNGWVRGEGEGWSQWVGEGIEE